MNASQRSASWSFAATNDAPGSARAEARAFLAARDVDARVVADVLLCVSEAVTNAVLHAYADGDAGVVTVEAFEQAGAVRFVVRDQGSGLQPRVDSPGFGVGLPIISQVASSSEIRTPASGGTEVDMAFSK